ncbi:MAG: hypothetical protein AAF492_28655, partial [Verrucomicrobiota bacterium]
RLDAEGHLHLSYLHHQRGEDFVSHAIYDGKVWAIDTRELPLPGAHMPGSCRMWLGEDGIPRLQISHFKPYAVRADQGGGLNITWDPDNWSLTSWNETDTKL